MTSLADRHELVLAHRVCSVSIPCTLHHLWQFGKRGCECVLWKKEDVNQKVKSTVVYGKGRFEIKSGIKIQSEIEDVKSDVKSTVVHEKGRCGIGCYKKKNRGFFASFFPSFLKSRMMISQMIFTDDLSDDFTRWFTVDFTDNFIDDFSFSFIFISHLFSHPKVQSLSVFEQQQARSPSLLHVHTDISHTVFWVLSFF